MNIFGARSTEPPDKDKIIFLTATRNGDQRKMQKLIKKHPAIVHARANESITALHYASFLGHNNLVEILLDADANINARVSNGWTPLHFAASGGEIENIKILLKHGAGINSRDTRGVTPLGVAIAARKDNSEQFLIEQGATMGGEDISYLNDGIELLGENDSKRGITALKEALRINPILASAHQILAIHYMGISDKNKAQKHYEILKDIDQKLAQKLLKTTLGHLFS